MKIILKTSLIILALGLSQISWAQDRNVKSFLKAHKSDKDATYMNARSGEDFNLESSELSGIMGLLGNIGAIKMLSINSSSKINTDFKHLKSKLNQKYETMFNMNDKDGGISVFTDEDNGYLYALIQGEGNVIVVSLESKE